MIRGLALGLLLALSGCGSLFKSREPPLTVYALRPSAAEKLEPSVPAVLLVARPGTAPGLDSDRVVVRLPDRRFETYAGVRFNGAVPDLLQSALISDLRARGAFRAVLTDKASFDGNYLLETEVREFSAGYSAEGGPPHVRVELTGILGRADGREPIATVHGEGESLATADRQRAIMQSFETALAAALTGIENAVHAACHADTAAHGPAR